MTPAYAAPEQVKGDEIGAATDVYQLGVLIYEVLTGTRPFDLEDKSFTEVERILMEEAPPAPSEQRLNDTEVEAGELRGDLDTIVLKALRKEPERRYRSVEALGADLRRYRGREPIEARPATFAYRTRKFVNRNQVTVGAGLMIALLVMTYAATVTVQADRLAEQRDRARTEAETARQVSGVLVDLFRNANPYENTDTLTARSLLRRGERRMSRLQDRPAVQAKLLGAMGRAYRGLGNYGRADSLLQRALSLRSRLYEAPHPELAKSLYHLGRIQHEQRRYALAESLHTEALAMRRRMYDAPHRRIAEGLHRRAATFEEQERYAAADSIFRHALSMYRSVFEGPHPKVAAALNDFGLALVG